MNRLVVKSHRPFHILLAVVLISLSLSAGVWFLLDNYHWSNIKQRLSHSAESRLLWDVNRNLENENKVLSEKVVRLERETQVDRMTAARLQSEIIKLQDEVYKLKGELEFYQGIMTSTRDSKGLNIQGLLIEAMKKPNHYRYKLVLTHVAKNDIVAEGRLEMSVEGMKDGNVQALKIEEVTADSELNLEFKFKNFKRIDGNLVLPEGFEPLRMSVRLRQKGKKNTTIERVFDWSDAVKS